jgi:hypothetical protein
MAIGSRYAVPCAQCAKSSGTGSIPVLHGPNLNLPRSPELCRRRSRAGIGAGPGVQVYERAVTHGLSRLDG